MPWLLAIVATSTPAARNACSPATGARNAYCFGAGVPRSVTAVSRFTTATSALDSTGAIGPSSDPGAATARDRNEPSKWTSPPNASVTGASGGRVVVVVLDDGARSAAVVAVARTCRLGEDPPLARTTTA